MQGRWVATTVPPSSVTWRRMSICSGLTHAAPCLTGTGAPWQPQPSLRARVPRAVSLAQAM